MSDDVLDLLGLGGTSAPNEVPALSKTSSTQPDDLDFGFNPDSKTSSTQPVDLDFGFNPDSLPSSQPPPAPSTNISTSNGPATSSIDAEELRRRIKGEGSEQPTSLQRVKTAAVGAASGASARLRKAASGATMRLRTRMAETPRWKLGCALFACALLVGGLPLYLRRSSSARAMDEVIVTGASKVPSKPSSKQSNSAANEDSAMSELTRAEKAEAKADDEIIADHMREQAAADGAVSNPTRRFPTKSAKAAEAWSQEFASLRDVVTQSTESLRAEIVALRKEVQKLSRRSRQGASSDEEAQTERESEPVAASTQQTRASSRSSGDVGEIRKETRSGGTRSNQFRGSRESRPAASESRSVASRAQAASAEQEDEGIGSVGEIVTR